NGGCAGRHRDRNAEALPVEPGSTCGDSSRNSAEYAGKLGFVVETVRPGREDEGHSRRREDADHERQEQKDGGQGHAALGGEEESKAPARRRDEQRAEIGGAMTVDGRPGALANPL